MNKSVESTASINPNKSRRRNLRAAGIALAATALLSACTSSSKESAETPRPVPTASATVEAKSPEQSAIDQAAKAQEKAKAQTEAAESYLASTERNTTLDNTVQALGKRIIDAAEDKRIGYFDFYNIDTEDWGRGKGNEGWGYLQHNPQYGGSEHQVFATVYQNADGSFNLDKGVQAVSVVMRDNPDVFEYVSIESPLTTKLVSDIELPLPAWKTSISLSKTDGGSHETREADAYNFEELTAEQLSALDTEVVSTLNRHIDELGL